MVQNDGINAPMLRCGEYSPNNPQFRVAAAPYLGLGEYEQRRLLFSHQRKEEYQNYLSEVSFPVLAMQRF